VATVNPCRTTDTRALGARPSTGLGSCKAAQNKIRSLDRAPFYDLELKILISL
jgi:hypothetical protein